METFKIEVQEFLARVVEVQAENKPEAFSKVDELYKKAEIVLDYNDFVEVDFIDINTQSKSDEIRKIMIEVVDYLYSNKVKYFEEMDRTHSQIFNKLERLKFLLDI